jgi:hypothetical protein
MARTATNKDAMLNDALAVAARSGRALVRDASNLRVQAEKLAKVQSKVDALRASQTKLAADHAETVALIKVLGGTAPAIEGLDENGAVIEPEPTPEPETESAPESDETAGETEVSPETVAEIDSAENASDESDTPAESETAPAGRKTTRRGTR